jgi:hypothetical protein
MSGLTQKQLVIGLVVIAALLAAIIGIIIYQGDGPMPAVDTAAQPAATDPAAGGGGGTAVQPAGGGEFDPATAPAVPAEETPEQYVTRYYQSAADGKYDEAYVMLPTATQAYYGDSAGFQSTLEGYGISGFSVNPQVEAEGQITVVGVQDAQGMQFPYTWVFVQGDDGSWLVKSRDMGAQ